MWMAILLTASAISFSLIGVLVQWNYNSNDRAAGAFLGCLGGLVVGYLSIVLARLAERRDHP